jgi:cobalt-zinc-cadmium efflux system membrane fusion protein
MKSLNKLLFIITLIIVTACGTKRENHNTEHAEEHEHEHKHSDVVYLTDEQQEVLDLQLGGISKRNITTVIKVNGQIKASPSNSADVTAIIGGNVVDIKVYQGDKVKKGQVLAVLEHPDYILLQEDFAEVTANLKFLKSEYERQKQLYDNNIGAGREYQKAKSQYLITKSKYEGLKARLQLLNISTNNVEQGKISKTIDIIAPIGGYVNDINIKLGTYVNAENVMFAITDNSKLHADFFIYEKDMYSIEKGQKVHFVVSSLPNVEFDTEVFAIGKKFKKNTRAIDVHSKIINSKFELVPGMFISGHLHIDGRYINTLPNTAIVRDGDDRYIFVEEDKDEHLHKNSTPFKLVRIVVGNRDDNYTEVSLLDSTKINNNIVMNVAYFLYAEITKEEATHEH